MIGQISLDFVASHIGKPYEYRAKGPDRFDCWSLVSLFYLEIHKIDLGFHQFDCDEFLKACRQIDTVKQDSNWKQIAEPIDGCLVAMSRNKHLHHVGIWIEGNGCLHALGNDNGGNVIMSDRQNLKLHRFTNVLFFLHNDQII